MLLSSSVWWANLVDSNCTNTRQSTDCGFYAFSLSSICHFLPSSNPYLPRTAVHIEAVVLWTCADVPAVSNYSYSDWTLPLTCQFLRKFCRRFWPVSRRHGVQAPNVLTHHLLSMVMFLSPIAAPNLPPLFIVLYRLSAEFLSSLPLYLWSISECYADLTDAKSWWMSVELAWGHLTRYATFGWHVTTQVTKSVRREPTWFPRMYLSWALDSWGMIMHASILDQIDPFVIFSWRLVIFPVDWYSYRFTSLIWKLLPWLDCCHLIC